MEPEDFPPNSSARRIPPRNEDEKLESVVTGGAKRRKKSLRKQFTETFVAGDAKSASNFVIFEVILPGARDMFLEALNQGAEKLMYGLGGRRRGGGLYPPQTGPMGLVNYNGIAQRMGMSSRFMQPTGPERTLSRQARASHNFDEIVLDLRAEAENVIDQLYNRVNSYGQVTVADLYELVGLGSTHVDHKWGWTDLQGIGVHRVRDGYLLDLPSPHPIT